MDAPPAAVQRPGWLGRARSRLPLVLLTAGLLVFTALVIIPFVWMILMSVRSTGEILNNPYGWPQPIR